MTKTSPFEISSTAADNFSMADDNFLRASVTDGEAAECAEINGVIETRRTTSDGSSFNSEIFRRNNLVQYFMQKKKIGLPFQQQLQ